MTIKRKSIIILLILIVSLMFALPIQALLIHDIKAEESSSITVSCNSYELKDGSGYKFESVSPTSSMTYGAKSLGSFSINGIFTDVSIYNDKLAYGVASNVSFSYSYDGWMQNRGEKNWNLSNDSSVSINGEKLTGSIGYGTVIVQISTDGQTYTSNNPITNCFNSNLSSFYTTNGSDIAQGSYYRIIFAYETKKLDHTSTNFPDFWNKTKHFNYKNHVEVYEFYLCRNDGVISLHNLAVEESSLTEEGMSLEMLKKGETLVDGSTTTKGFSIDKLGTSYVVSVSKDGTIISSNASDGQQFTENGKYEITTVTQLGKQVETTLYVFNGGDDKGISTYFDNYIVNGHRVYRDKDYPIFAKDSKMKVNERSQNLPQLYGKLINTTNNIEYSFSNGLTEESIVLTAGIYLGTFYVGNPNIAGSIYKYSVNFEIIDENSSPYINYYNLMNSNNLEDLATKHYEVAYQTTKGGYVFACFSLASKQEALNYAYEIEGRFIEQAEDGGLYYKSETNPNNKVKYYDPIELTRIRNIYAAQNVEINYFNATDEYTYRTFNNDLLTELESINIEKSIKVFPSQAEKEKMLDRQPFLNNFSFVKVADFDSVSVSAYCYKNGKTYNIEYNKSISQQLNVSSKYKITEKNEYNDIKEYDAYFVTENLTSSSWEVSYNGTTQTVNLSPSTLVDNKITVTADSVSILSISNEFDENAIVTIKAPEVYSFEIKCLISELKDIELYKQGNYEISFIDRMGNSYKLILNITGVTRFVSLKATSKCYTAFYNTIALQAKAFDEEIMLDATSLKELIDTPINKNLYTSNSYNVYKQALDSAKVVYNNPQATQSEINNAGYVLNNAVKGLVQSADKTELNSELEKYSSLNKVLYTSTSVLKYTSTYNIAKIVYADDSVSDDDVSEAVYAMKQSYNSLVLRGDKTQLKEKLIEVQNIYCEKYTPNSIEEVETVFNKAYAVYTDIDAIQSEIDAIIIEIEGTINILVLRADFTELENVLRNVAALNPNYYSSKTIETLHNKYEEAIVIYNNKNSTQSQVNIQVVKLQEAYNNLVETGDRKGLLELAKSVKDIKLFLYTKTTAKNVETAYDTAISVLSNSLSSANDVSEAINSLTSAKNNLVQDSNKVELYNYLQEIESKDLSRYSKDSKNALLTQYNKGYKVLYNYDSSEQEIQQAKASIEKTNNELKKAGLSWGQIIIVIVITIAGYLVITCWFDLEVFMWDSIFVRVLNGLITSATMIILFIFTSLSWWMISIIDIAILCLIGLGLGAFVENN